MTVRTAKCRYPCKVEIESSLPEFQYPPHDQCSSPLALPRRYLHASAASWNDSSFNELRKRRSPLQRLLDACSSSLVLQTLCRLLHAGFEEALFLDELLGKSTAQHTLKLIGDMRTRCTFVEEPCVNEGRAVYDVGEAAWRGRRAFC